MKIINFSTFFILFFVALCFLKLKGFEMMMEDSRQIIYSRNTLEFVTVAVEFCAYLEQSEGRKRAEFVDTMLKLLPLLYLKASLAEKVESGEDFYPEDFVTEHDYELIRTVLAGVMGEDDDYLDFYNEDARFSDEAVAKTVSEDLADLYQAIKNFSEAYKSGLDENMWEAVAAVKEGFELYWGQTLTNVMRALHRVRYTPRDEDEDCGCEDDGCGCGDEDCDCHHHGHCD